MFVDILKNKFKVIVGLVFILWFLISCQKDYERSYKEGHKIFKEKDLSLMEDAVRNFEESLFFALESIESKYLVLKYLGIKLAEEKKYLECVNALNRAHKVKQGDSDLYYYLGLCYTNYANLAINEKEKLQYITLAKNTYLTGLKADTENGYLYYGLGILYGFVMKDAVKQGIESLELAIDKGNNQANTLFALGNLNYKIGKKQIASNYYKEIIKRSPKNSNKWKQAKSNLLKIEKEKKSK